MSATIYIANRGLNDFEFHSYLVYDPDGNPETLDGQLILSGHPYNPINTGDLGLGGPIVLEVDFQNANSRDTLDTNHDGINDVSVASRDYTAIDLSPVLGTTYQTVDDVWGAMVFYALGLASDSNQVDPDGRYVTDYDYHTFGTNSNSVVATLLSSVGIDFQINKPQGENSVTLGFIGSSNFLSGSGSDVLQGFDDDDKFYDKGGGNDVFYGGTIDNKVVRDEGDGYDVVIYENGGFAGLGLKIRMVAGGEEDNFAYYRQVDDKEGGTDKLFSIEQVNMRTFFLGNTYDGTGNFEPIELRNKTRSELENQNEIYGDTVSSVVIDEGFGNTIVLNNFGTFVGSAYDDRFILNDVQGLRFEGGGQGISGDKLSYADMTDARGLTFDGGLGTVLITGTDLGAGPVAPVYDSFAGMEIIEGSAAGDKFYGSGAADSFRGGGGNDEFYFSAGTDALYGDGGVDKLYLEGTGRYEVGASAYKIIGSSVTSTYESIEEIFLGTGDDRINSGYNIGGMTESHALRTYDAGDGIDTVLLSNSSIAGSMVIEGVVYSESGASIVKNAETIDTGLSYVHVVDMGMTYTGGGFIDYSGYGLSLNIDTRTGISDGTNTDTFVFGRPNIVGTNQGDNYYIHTGIWAWLGKGNDVVRSSDLANAKVYYSGGDDVIYGQGIKSLKLDPGIKAADVSFEKNIIEISTEIVGGRELTKTSFDLIVTIQGKGSVTLKDHYSYEDGGEFLGHSTPTIELWNGSYFDGDTLDFSLVGNGDFVSTSGTYYDDVLQGNVHMSGLSGDDILIAGNSDVNLSGGVGNDDLSGGDGVNLLSGGFGDDLMRGGGNTDYLHGGFGNDTLYGDTGNDFVFGEAGDDILHGGDGNDVLSGGEGTDILYGGAGDDVYLFTSDGSYDRIIDTQGANVVRIDDQDIAYSDLKFVRVGNDLRIDIASGLIIEGFYSEPSTLSHIIFTGSNQSFDLSVLQDLEPGNTFPEAASDVFTALEGQTVSGNVLADNGNGVDSDADGDTLSVVPAEIITAGGGSVLLLDDGRFIYTPLADFNGLDSFTYALQDGQGGSDIGTVFLNITPVNDGPEARDDAFAVNEDTVLIGNVLADNGAGADSDLDGDNLSVTAGVFATLAGGSVILNADGSFAYTPAANFNGPDSFTYHVTDGHGGSATGTASITVNAVNDGPEAKDDIFSGTQDSEIEGNLLADNGNGADFDLEGDALRVVQTVAISAAGGSVILMANGDFAYMPPAGFAGNDSFEYTVTDGHGGEATASAFITLAPIVTNHDPVAQDDSQAGFILQTLGGNVLQDNGHGADSDPDGDSLSVQPAGFMTANGGLVMIMANGDYTYTPVAGFKGSDSFTYTVLDGQGGQDTATVTLHVSFRGHEILGNNQGNHIEGSKRGDTILGLGGNDTIEGRQADDRILGGSGHDNLYGNNGNDLLIGGSGKDRLEGGNGNDRLIGDDIYLLPDNQYRYAGADGGNDVLNGGHGNDLLIGGGGNDTLYGGSGSDIFKYLKGNSGTDTIKDFNICSGDKIDISDVLSEAYDPVADMIAEWVRLETSANKVTLSVDMDGAANGSNFTAIAIIEGGQNLTLDSLVQNNSLII